jgi:voltage-gated potassium channel
MGARRRIFEMLEVGAPDDRPSRRVDGLLLSLIALNVIALVLESVASIERRFGALLRWFEIVSVAVFSVEYALRLWVCTLRPGYHGKIGGRLRFALSPLALVDLLAVLPFYLPFLGVDLRFFRSLRLFRIFRIAKLSRYSASMRRLGSAFRSKKEELAISLFVLVLLLLSSSSLMYFVEQEAQPEVFSSIPASMWWGVATLTTVGYGDSYPVTQVGKLLGSIIAILGIGMFALPTSILGAAFVDAMDKNRPQPPGTGEERTCPHCGGSLNEAR